MSYGFRLKELHDLRASEVISSEWTLKESEQIHEMLNDEESRIRRRIKVDLKALRGE